MLFSRGTFLYKDMTSAGTKRALNERGGRFSKRLRKCFVSKMGDVSREMISWIITSRNNRVERVVWLVNFR